MSLPFKEWKDLSKLTGNILRPGGLSITNDALRNCNFNNGHYLLDLGCGLGVTAGHLSSLGHNVLGIDLSSQLLKEAYAKIYASKYINSTIIKIPAFIQGDINYLPIKNTCLHGVFCECVLSLLQNTESIIKELYRILHNGGKLIISDIVSKNATADLIRENNGLALENMESKGNIKDILCKEPLNSKNKKISCVQGALALNQLKNTLSGIGFKIILEKDYSYALAELAALLVLHDVNIKDYFIRDKNDCTCKQYKDLGYVLLVAEKI